MIIAAQKLQKIVDKVYPFISKHDTLPVLKLARFTVKDSMLTISATNMEMYIDVYEAVDSDDCDFLVDLDNIKDALSIYKDGNVSITHKWYKVDIQFGKNKLSHNTQDISEYPSFPKVTSDNYVSLPGIEINNIINSISHIIPTKSFNITFTWLHLNGEYAEWTDWFALVRQKISKDTWLDIIIPSFALKPLQSLLCSDNKILKSANLLCIEWEWYRMITVLIQWVYPPVQTLMDKKWWDEVSISWYTALLDIAMKQSDNLYWIILWNNKIKSIQWSMSDFEWDIDYTWREFSINGKYMKICSKLMWDTIWWLLWDFLYIQHDNLEMLIRPINT